MGFPLSNSTSTLARLMIRFLGKKCPNCKGRGEIARYEEVPLFRTMAWRWWTCETCDGIGKLWPGSKRG